MLRFAFYKDHSDTAWGVHFRETGVNVGYSFNAVLVVEAKHGGSSCYKEQWRWKEGDG